MSVLVYAIDGIATVRTAATRASGGCRIRRARKYAGTAASDMIAELIPFAAS